MTFFDKNVYNVKIIITIYALKVQHLNKSANPSILINEIKTSLNTTQLLISQGIPRIFSITLYEHNFNYKSE